MIWFTSDLHFHHSNILKFTDRRHRDVKEMNRHIIAIWNNQVRKSDTVVVVGDFSFGNSKQRTEVLEGLNGTKILVQGNHDKGNTCPKGFDLMVSSISMRISGHKVTVSHYPLRIGWFRSFLRSFPRLPSKPRYLKRMLWDEGQFHIHGHTHDVDKFNDKQIHVGWDAWGRLVGINEIISYIHRRGK